MNLYPHFSFVVHNKYNGAKTGTITTPNGTIQTPAFIFCATKASIKSLTPDQIAHTNTQIILSNTYHLLVNGGAKTMAKCGGIHKFMNWPGPTLTDSGGFQILSFGYGSVGEDLKSKLINPDKKMLKAIKESGASFKSYLDGRHIMLTPEESIRVQRKIGADIILVFDECPSCTSDRSYIEESTLRSHRWESRSFAEFVKTDNQRQALYGIVHGGTYQDLRQMSAEFVNSMDFFGQAIGGVLGKTKEKMYEVVSFTMQYVRQDRPTHLLGIGKIKDIFAHIKCGIDTFDCVHPTRIARHGSMIFSRKILDQYGVPNTGESQREYLNIRNSRFQDMYHKIDETCLCYTCQHFSPAYLHYTLAAKEMVGMQLITIHNMFTMNRIMSDIRTGIANQDLERVQDKWIGS